jgi:hypothetical protein
LADRIVTAAGAARVWAGRALGAIELVRLGVITRGRFRGPYWQWRMHTAFGRGMPKTRRELIESALDYGRWARRMRRGL